MPEDPVETPIARYIRTHRTRAGLTQNAFAKAIGVSQNAVWHWENSTRTPDVHSLAVLAKHLPGADFMEMVNRISWPDQYTDSDEVAS